MKGFLRFGPRSWGSDDSRQHPLPPRASNCRLRPPPNKLHQQPQLRALCWGLEGLIPIPVPQQAKTFPIPGFRLVSLPTRPFRRAVEKDATAGPGTLDPATTARAEGAAERPGRDAWSKKLKADASSCTYRGFGMQIWKLDVPELGGCV
ncbi:uncharacterized protein LOC144289788 [Canis aureus]